MTAPVIPQAHPGIELAKQHQPDGRLPILCLDGGGAKGFYTLGILREIEAMLECHLYKRFDLIFGTSTGSIIGALLALGNDVESIHTLYKLHVPTVMKARSRAEKSRALRELAGQIFGDQKFDAFKTGIGIVTTKWMIERPMIFKASVAQAHGRVGTFAPGFGCTIADAVEASCSAFPFFEKKMVTTAAGDSVLLIDGGYCANNPTLYAIADAVGPLAYARSDIRVVSLGVGAYPPPKQSWVMWTLNKTLPVQLLQKTLEINTQSMEQLRAILFKDFPTVRISDTFEQPEMATDFFEHNLHKLNILRQRGAESFALREAQLKKCLFEKTLAETKWQFQNLSLRRGRTKVRSQRRAIPMPPLKWRWKSSNARHAQQWDQNPKQPSVQCEQAIQETETILLRELRNAIKPRPANPANIIAHVGDSGAPSERK